MIKYFIYLLFPIISLSCGSAGIQSNDKYFFDIGFQGSDLNYKSINIYVNDNLIFEDVSFKEVTYNLNYFDIGFRYKNNLFELYNLRNGGVVLKTKEYNIKDLNKIKITLEIDEQLYDKIINIKYGKYYHIKYDDGKTELIRLKNLE